jgi:DNA-directed RNA polymerase subunit RPC12/RpoP
LKHKTSNRKVPEERFKDKQEDLRADNRKLRKQVSQLQKELVRLKNRDEGLQDLIQEFGQLEEQLETQESKPKIICPHCSSRNVKLLDLRYERSHFNCVECGKTGPVK